MSAMRRLRAQESWMLLVIAIWLGWRDLIRRRRRRRIMSAELRERLEEAVKLRLVSDVPLGAFLERRA